MYKVLKMLILLALLSTVTGCGSTNQSRVGILFGLYQAEYYKAENPNGRN